MRHILRILRTLKDIKTNFFVKRLVDRLTRQTLFPHRLERLNLRLNHLASPHFALHQCAFLISCRLITLRLELPHPASPHFALLCSTIVLPCLTSSRLDVPFCPVVCNLVSSDIVSTDFGCIVLGNVALPALSPCNFVLILKKENQKAKKYKCICCFCAFYMLELAGCCTGYVRSAYPGRCHPVR